MKVNCTRFCMVVLEFHISGRIFILHCVIHLLWLRCLSISFEATIFFFFVCFKWLWFFSLWCLWHYEIILCETVCISGSHLLLMPFFVSFYRLLSLCMVLEQIFCKRISFKKLDFLCLWLYLEKVFCILRYNFFCLIIQVQEEWYSCKQKMLNIFVFLFVLYFCGCHYYDVVFKSGEV
jgi:hypothetical protein